MMQAWYKDHYCNTSFNYYLFLWGTTLVNLHECSPMWVGLFMKVKSENSFILFNNKNNNNDVHSDYIWSIKLLSNVAWKSILLLHVLYKCTRNIYQQGTLKVVKVKNVNLLFRSLWFWSGEVLLANVHKLMITR